jgi:hypothetical protein
MAPTVDDVRRIAAIRNPVIRNLEITHCYSELAKAFAARSGEGANWCTYATWASRQAGRTIRGEDLVLQLGRRCEEARWLLHPWRCVLRRGLFNPGSRIGRLTAKLHTPLDAFERASDAVARGNLKVFAEIGLEFARYLHDCAPDGPVDRFLDGLPESLRRAFAHYHRRHFESDPKRRAELALLANLEIGFHEQERLQPEIRAALDASSATYAGLGVLTAIL